MTQSDDVLIQLVKWLAAKAPKSRQIEFSKVPSDIDIDNLELSEDPEQLHSVLRRLKLPRQRSFILGSVTTGTFLMQSSATHRVTRRKGGTSWDVYVSGADFPAGEEHMGSYASEDVRSLAEELGYEYTLRDWLGMGWRPSSILQLSARR